MAKIFLESVVEFRDRLPLEFNKCREIALQVYENSSDEILRKLTSTDIPHTDEYVQTIVFMFLQMGAMQSSLKDKAAHIIKKLSSRMNLPIEKYKDVVIAFAIKVCQNPVEESSNELTNLVEVIKELYRQSFFDRNDIIKVLFFLSKYVKLVKNGDIALVQFVEGFESFFTPRNLSQNARKRINKIGDSLKVIIKCEEVTQDTKRNLTEVLKVLHVTDNLNTIVMKDKSVSESFKTFVQKIEDEEEIDGEVLLENHEMEVEYFLAFAVKDVGNAVKFAKLLPSLFHNDPCSAYLFRELMISTSGSNFLRQHSEETAKNFTEIETQATNRFIAELLFKGYVTDAQAQTTLNVINAKPYKSELTTSCLALMLKVLAANKTNSGANTEINLIECTDDYFESELQKAIETGDISVDFKVPKDENIKRRWTEILFRKSMKNFAVSEKIFEFFKEIIDRSPCKFTILEAQSLLEEKVIEEYRNNIASQRNHEILENHEIQTFATKLVKSSLISKAGVINIWFVISQQLTEKWFIVPSLVFFIKKCSEFVRNVNEDEMIGKMNFVIETLKVFLYKAELRSHRNGIRHTLTYLIDLAQNSTPEVGLQQDDEYPGIDKGFKNIVSTLLNKNLTYGSSFQLLSSKKDAKFYFSNAILNMQTAKELGSFTTSIVNQKDALTKTFKSELLLLCEKRFIRQHSIETRNEYSDEEILATNRFICELLFWKCMANKKAETLLLFAKSQTPRTSVSIGCTAMLLSAVISSQMEAMKTTTFDECSLTGLKVMLQSGKSDNPGVFEVIPMDTQIKKNWLHALMTLGVGGQEDSESIIKFCHYVVERNPTEFNMNDWQHFCELKMIEFLHEVLDQMMESGAVQRSQKATEFLMCLFKKSMITNGGIVNIWHAVAEHIEDKFFIATILAAIIKESQTFVKFIEDKDSRDKVTSIIETLTPQLKSMKVKKHQKDIKYVIRYLENLAQIPTEAAQQSSQTLQASSSQVSKHAKKIQELDSVKKSQKTDEPQASSADESFKRFVEKLHAEEFINMTYSINNPKEDAKYYLENAVRDEATALKFALVTDIIESDKFKTELLEICEVNFRKHHSSLTCKNFSTNEIVATSRFIAEILLKKLMPVTTGETLINFASIQPRLSKVSRACVLSLTLALDRSKALSSQSTKEKTAKHNENASQHPDEVYLQTLLDNLSNDDEFGLDYIPNDQPMVVKWLEMLFKKCVQCPHYSSSIISVCKEIAEKNSTDFKLKNLKKLFEAKVVDEYHKMLTNPEENKVMKRREHKLTEFSMGLVQQSLVTTTGTIKIWKAISDHISADSFDSIPLLATFIKETKDDIKTVEGKKLQGVVSQVREKIVMHVTNTEFATYKELFKDVLQYLHDLINPPPSSSSSKKLQTTEESKNDAQQLEEVQQRPTPEGEFEIILKSNSEIDESQLKEIIKKTGSSEKEIKNFVKIFFESVKHRSEVGELALKVNRCFESIEETNSDETFVKVFLSTLQSSFKKLPKFDQLSSAEEIDRAEFLVRLTGELYNIGWIDQPKLIGCMDKLSLNNFGSDHQLKMFHSLLQNVESEMIRQSFIGKSKYYIELLSSSNPNRKIRKLKCVEVLQRISASTKDSQETADDIDDCGNNLDLVLLEKLSYKTVTDIAREFTEKFSTDDAEQVLVMIEKFTTKALDNPKLYAKLVTAIDSSTFKSLVLDQCQEDFLDSTNSEKIEPKVIDLVMFIGELYNEGLAPEELVKVCMDVLFGVKSPCDVTVDSISMLVRTVRVKMEHSDKEKFDRYFMYFNFVVDQKEDSYRSMMFKFLIALRNNKWKCDVNATQPLIDHHLNQLSEEEIPSIALKLKQFIEDSEAIAIVVIRKIWEIVILKPELTSLSANLTGEIYEVELLQEDGTKLMFADLLVQFLTQRHAVFSSIPTDQFIDKIKERLGQVVTFIAELYQLKIVSDKFMEIWLDEKFIDNLTIVHVAQLSTILSGKVNDINSIQLKLKVMSLDEKVNKDNEKCMKLIQKDLQDLSENVRFKSRSDCS